MSETDNNIFSGCWQVALVIVLIAGSLMFCVYAADIRISTTPPAPTVAPAPTSTPDALYVILTEQAKASAKAQVITAETDNEIKLRWNIHYMRRWWAVWLIPVLVIIATSAWLIAYKRGRGQDG